MSLSTPCRLLAAASLALSLVPAAAEPLQVSAGHFEVRHRAVVKATTAQVYAALTQLPRWWHPQHTWSGDARNLSLELGPGGCWCERWGDGAWAQHARVLHVQPGRMILLQAALGPLQMLPAQGLFTMVTGTQDGQTAVRLSYRVSGAPELALDKLAPAVDDVLGVQFKRLVSLIETGRCRSDARRRRRRAVGPRVGPVAPAAPQCACCLLPAKAVGAGSTPCPRCSSTHGAHSSTAGSGSPPAGRGTCTTCARCATAALPASPPAARPCACRPARR